MPSTWLYVMVTAKEQAVDGAALPAQAKEARRIIDQMGLELGPDSNYEYPGVFADPGVSTWRMSLFERPGFQALWKMAKPGDNIALLTFDRGFRSVLDFANSVGEFQRANRNLIFLREQLNLRSPEGRMRAKMCPAFAAYRSVLTSQHIREARAIRRQTRSRSMAQADGQERVQQGVVCASESASKRHGSIGRVFGYERFSVGMPGLQWQSVMVAGTARRLTGQGYQYSGTFKDEGTSSFVTDWEDRPQGRELCSQLASGDIVVVQRVDRAFRSVADLATTLKAMMERDIHLVVAGGLDTRTELGRETVDALYTMSEWDSQDLSNRMAQAYQVRQVCRGKWACPQNLPAFMKPVQHSEDTWTAHPNFEWIEQLREVHQLLQAGFTQRQVSDLMEERLAARENRPTFPPVRFVRELILRRASVESRASLKEWFEHRQPDSRGEYDRDWSVTRIQWHRRQMPEIEQMMAG